MTRESTAYDAAAERFLAVESELEAKASSPAPVEGMVYDPQVLSPAALPTSVRRRLAEELSTLRLQEATDTAGDDDQLGSRPDRTELSAFPRPVVAEPDDDATEWADDVLSVLPDRLVALTVVDPSAGVDFFPTEVEREQLADAVGHQAAVTAFVFPEATEITDRLGLPTLEGLFDVVDDAGSVAELNQRIVPLKPLDGSTAFVHTQENRELPSVEFAIERTAFRAGNFEVENGVCRIDPELKARLERTQKSQRAQNEFVFGGLLATVGALPVVNLIVQSTLTTSGLISPLLFSVAVFCLALAVSRLGMSSHELETVAATPN